MRDCRANDDSGRLRTDDCVAWLRQRWQTSFGLDQSGSWPEQYLRSALFLRDGCIVGNGVILDAHVETTRSKFADHVKNSSPGVSLACAHDPRALQRVRRWLCLEHAE